MKSMVLQFLLILACALGGGPFYGQDLPGPRPKRARTAEDYQPRTLKEIGAASKPESSRDEGGGRVVLSDLFPSRVRVAYIGSARSLPKNKKDVLHSWAQRYAGAPQHYTVPYGTELLFSEDGREYWLAVNKDLLPQFKAELKKGESLDLYVIRLGGIRTKGKWESVLLVETFAKPKTISH
ncbi:MAG: hypothetical protein ACR2HX_24150 [Pyrinomonadaceae bacterium]